MPIKLKPSVVRAALLGGVAAFLIAVVARAVPVVGWLIIPLALGTGALAAIIGRHEPGPTFSFGKPAGGMAGTPPTPGPGPSGVSVDAVAGTESSGASANDAGASADPAGARTTSPAPPSLNDLLPGISDGAVAGVLVGVVIMMVVLSDLCCSDCLSFLQAAESVAIGRMIGLIDQAFTDAITSFGPPFVGAVFGGLGGGLGGVATGAQR
jgi:hypothetical protein